MLDEIAERVAGAPRGLIIAGRQLDGRLAAPVADLASSAGYPILAEPTSQLRVGEHDRKLVVWPYDLIARLRPAELEPEVVIRFGDMPTSKALRGWLASLPDLRQIVVDPTFGWNEPSSRAETIVRADAGSVATGLAARLRRGAGDWPGRWIAAGRSAAEAIEAELSAVGEPTEPGIHASLSRLYRDGELVYTASSMPIRDQEAFVPTGPAQVRFLCNRGANGIDGLISSGVGAAAATGRPAWIITGDLGLYHDMNGLAAVSELSAPGADRGRATTTAAGSSSSCRRLSQLDRDEFEALLGTPLGNRPREGCRNPWPPPLPGRGSPRAR